ncbi:hypothetical protein QR680_015151 [Steinernema hermaphroditum]|uniref:Protein kinase domain-containing protein n=1 Tax=Steinernema hermaphroditum TaxID=289476 RepID=A0AA39ICR8_9BILA|nr:hypothetical protein QR680_015151 [Steinernema hermaphroditum]
MASPEKENQSRSLSSFFDLNNRKTASRLSEPSRSSDHEADSPVKFGSVNRATKPPTAQKNITRKGNIDNGRKSARKITDYLGFNKTSPSKNPGGPVGMLSGSDNSLSGAGDFRFSDSDIGASSANTPRKNKRSKMEDPTRNAAAQTVDERPRGIILDETARQLYEENDRLMREREEAEQRLEGYMQTMMKLLIKESMVQRQEASHETCSNLERLGKFEPVRQGDRFILEFVDGKAFAELADKRRELANENERVAAANVHLRRLRQALRARDRDGFAAPQVTDVDSLEMEIVLYETNLKTMKDKLKARAAELEAYTNRLNIERELHRRELLRQENENTSKFKDFGLLSKRYLPLRLAGKGGFSEVWKAYDLIDNIYVACKIHYVNPAWSVTVRENYVRHVIRERDIQKMISHDRIVKLYDVFYIDSDSYCTVLEYCEGDDLETYLKNYSINERQTTSVIQQMCNALLYLSERSPPIIHYDLKPANILLRKSTVLEVKITDFGLSKIMDSCDGSIELTSVGAGTLWYLPPECFPHGPGAARPKICSKVDVWSVGVIFYQMLYGIKPFGNGETQRSLWQNGTIARADEVVFPATPAVSELAKDFIRRCLQANRENRADFRELCAHEIFTEKARNNLSDKNKRDQICRPCASSSSDS